MSYTSTIFDTWDALYAALEGCSFGYHPLNHKQETKLHFGFPEDQAELGVEHVVLIGGIEGGEQSQWSFGAPGRRQEDFTLLVVGTVAVKGGDHASVRLRLKEISAAVEDAVRSARAGSGNAQPRPDVTGVDWWQIGYVHPLVTGDTNGHIGRVEIAVNVRAHI